MQRQNKDIIECWVCGHANQKNNITRCKSCGHVFRNYPKIDLRQYYTEQYWKDVRKPSGLEGKKTKEMITHSNFILNKLSNYISDNASFFEVGFGWGMFYDQLKKRFPLVEYSCCEISTSLSNRNKKRGIKTHNCSFQEVQTAKKFDVVASFDVLEHLYDPKPYKDKLLEIVKPGSLAIIQVPINRELHFRQPFDGHYHYFSPQSLRLFMCKEFEEVMLYETKKGEAASGQELLTVWRRRGENK